MPTITQLQRLPDGSMGISLDMSKAPEGAWVKMYWADEIETLLHQTRMAEREACAALADKYAALAWKAQPSAQEAAVAAQHIAEAIRNRKE